jgi:putative nucleotidyltransferase with HDIG domain
VLAVVVWIALVVWLALVIWSLSVVRGAAGTEAADTRAATPARPQRLPYAGRRRVIELGQAVLLAAAVAAAVLLSSGEQWRPLALVGLLGLLVLGSDILVLDAKRFRIGGSFTGLVLAMALLGPAPAAALGLASASVDAVRRHVRGSYLLNNLLTYMTFPLLGGLVLHRLDSSDPKEGGYAVAVFGVFLAANVVNFLMIAGHTRLLRGGSLWQMFRQVFVPVLPWEVASAVMTAMAVYGFEVYGAGIIGLFALALGVYQLLLRALLEGQANSEEIERRTDQLDVRHEGMLGLLLETLALRDPSAARHAAAVAHYAHQLARAAGLSEREQAIVHTAGLLHDLGKVAVPETILHKPAKLTPEEYEIIKQHAPTGERILAEVGPLGEVARMVGEHHERYNGSGYPAAKRGEAISIGGRVLAVADTLDSILSDRPYAQGKPLPWALDEIDRCAGTLFDPVVAAALHRLVQDRGPEFFFTSPRQTVEALRELELVS